MLIFWRQLSKCPRHVCLAKNSILLSMTKRRHIYFILCVGIPSMMETKEREQVTAYLFLRINNAPILFESYFEDEGFEKFVLKVAHVKIKKKAIAYFLKHGKELV